MNHPRSACARPSPGFDPLDDCEDDGAEQATEADVDDPISERVPKRSKRRTSTDKKKQPEQANGTHQA